MPEIDVAPGPPAFRADVQALRAMAVAVVVLYHAQLPGIHGGFLGVDVFFVISGFVITGVLLRERQSSSRTSLVAFYGRRIRRILPIATLVLVVTVMASYHYLGFIAGARSAHDAYWVALFLGNFHFASVGTDYFGANLPPSTLQQYWSLAVEEQFYLVWPLLFAAIAAGSTAGRQRRRLLLALVAIMAASLAWSIIETSQNQVWAFFSPLTRAWELALGAAIAVAGPWLADRAPRIGLALASVGWLGIALSCWLITSTTPWPGSAVIAPVLATGLVIAGGSMRVSASPGLLVRSGPVQWLGKVSYSLYLLHWPILTIAAQYSLAPLSRPVELGLVALALLASALSYRFIEDPVRRSSLLKGRSELTYLMGAALIGISLLVAFIELGQP